MQTKEIEKYSVWARNELRRGVSQRAYDYALDPSADNFEPIDAAQVNGRVLTNLERDRRAELFRRVQECGFERLVEDMAYTWFNRIVGIRCLEMRDALPSRTRLFSSAQDAGEFRPQALSEATTVEISGLDRERVYELMDAADDEGLFRELLLAQCDELAVFLPRVFGHVGGADALMLPQNLLRPDSVVVRLVTDIPLEAWDDVEILGWMYQSYISEKKDEVFAGFKNKVKVKADTLGPATQLFTPDWIVAYMVDNTLGRLWMLNHPESGLRDRADEGLMRYYIEPDGQVEDFIRVSSPEDIALCDPACGSGHILVYAFKMLAAIYEECGYRRRDIPQLILTKNLTGFEIDERAAQYAVLALTVRALELDRRFLSRGVEPNIVALESVELDAEALDPAGALAEKNELLDALAHLGEAGSLLRPSESDVMALEAELRRVSGGDLLSQNLRAGLERALAACKALSQRFDCVVANPPYMGSSNFNDWMSAWTRNNYTDEKSDLCTCFIERGFSLAKPDGYVSMVTMQSWMFLGSFEKMRDKVIDGRTILSMCHLGTRAFDAIAGEVVSTTATTFLSSHQDVQGSYARLVDIAGSEPKREAFLEAIHNPTCGWFYRADATTFHDIPGSPIAYWASKTLIHAFSAGISMKKLCRPTAGIRTGNNDRFLRLWWEVEAGAFYSSAQTRQQAMESHAKWFPCAKGGQFRKWYGNLEHAIDWENDGERLRAYPGCDNAGVSFFFRQGSTWSTITGSSIAFRLLPVGCISERCGSALFSDSDTNLLCCMALQNSAVGAFAHAILSPGLSVREASVGQIPVLKEVVQKSVADFVSQQICSSKSDYDSQETSWDFKRHSLV